MSKVSLPSTFVLNLYYYFSYLTLFLTWMIAPILFYVTITQSKYLNGFKWFILNHSFWCLMLETIVCFSKPLLLTPAVAGFPLSLIRENGSFMKTAIGFLVMNGCVLNFAIGLTVTIFTRYLLIFPSPVARYFNFKIIILFAAGCSITAYIIFYIIGSNNLFGDVHNILEPAKDYDSFFKNFYEVSMVFVSFKNVQIYAYLVFFVLIILLIFAIFVALFFIHLVQTNMTVTTLKVQKHLIISSIIQMFSVCLFLILPILCANITIVFQIPHSAGLTTICFSIISSYSVIDFIGTLYFIAPYRRFISKKIEKFMPCLKKRRKVSAIGI